MNLVTAIFSYLMIWWIALFVVLPFGNKPLENPLVGNEPNAPANPRLRQKMVWTSLLALVVWAIVFALVQSHLISFRDMVKDIPD